MRICPRCGARNPETADWCTQCYADLRPPPETPETPVVDQVDPRRRGGTPSATAEGDRFRKLDDELEWRCVVCQNWNPVGVTACPVCGTPFGRTLGIADDEAAPLRDVDEGTALIASAILPGAGHILLGRSAMGAVRTVTYLLWAVGGWVMLRGAAGSDGSILPAVPLLLGAFALWVTSCWDAVMLAGERGPEVLTPRVFFWLVIGVVGLLIMSVVPAIMQAGTARQVDEDVPVDTDPAPVQTVTVTAPPPVETTTAPFPGTVPTTPTGPAPFETPS